MPKLIIIIGLPGSGKTYYQKTLRDKGEIDCEYDDFHAKAFGDSARVVHSRHFCELVDRLKDGRNCGINDVAFCYTERLAEMQDKINKCLKGVVIDLCYFENSPEACKKNIKDRGHAGIDEEITKVDKLTVEYHIPRGTNKIPVYVKP